jgi:hypothetical protein
MDLKRCLQKLSAGFLLLALLATFTFQTAFAHEDEPVEAVNASVGPYLVQIGYMEEVRAGQEVHLIVITLTETEGPVTYSLTAVSTEGEQFSIPLSPDPDNERASTGSITIPDSGSWNLVITGEGAEGSGSAEVPLIENSSLLSGNLLRLIGLGAALIGAAFFILRRTRS